MKDELGERMKGQYEDRTRFSVPRRTYTIIRLDGKAFHTYTKNLTKPFDQALADDMDAAVISMMRDVQGAQFAYVQSDEISILLTDFAQPTTSAWFDGNVQKVASVSASLITAAFNRIRWKRMIEENGFREELDSPSNVLDATSFINDTAKNIAYFDSRIFTIPDRMEVMNYFIWRNQDCMRNAVSMIAQSKFPHKQLQGKSTLEMVHMLSDIGSPIDNYRQEDKCGRLIEKEEYTIPCPPEFHQAGCGSPDLLRTRWVSGPAWKFTENKEALLDIIPKYE
jgi:tRNA(His) 5'-end guanylyltransferase